MSFFSPSKPTPPAPPPAPPTTDAANTSKAVTAQATPQTGRASNVAAGADPSLQDSTDQYSVRKKLLGA